MQGGVKVSAGHGRLYSQTMATGLAHHGGSRHRPDPPPLQTCYFADQFENLGS